MIHIYTFHVYETQHHYLKQNILNVTGVTADGNYKFSIFYRYHPEKDEKVGYYLGQDFPAEIVILNKNIELDSTKLTQVYYQVYEYIFYLINNGYPVAFNEHAKMNA